MNKMSRTNRILINVAIWCLERMKFESETNTNLMKTRLDAVKRMKGCI